MIYFDEKNYWREVVKILIHITSNDDAITLSDLLKNEIKRRIIDSIYENNFLAAKLLIYDKITKNILLNFLLYNAINRKITYQLFLNNPEKYCKTYMFCISPQYLPNIERIFTVNEIDEISDKIKINQLADRIGLADLDTLTKLFPKAIYF